MVFVIASVTLAEKEIEAIFLQEVNQLSSYFGLFGTVLHTQSPEVSLLAALQFRTDALYPSS